MLYVLNSIHLLSIDDHTSVIMSVLTLRISDNATVGEIQKLYYGYMLLNICKWHKCTVRKFSVFGNNLISINMHIIKHANLLLLV